MNGLQKLFSFMFLCAAVLVSAGCAGREERAETPPPLESLEPGGLIPAYPGAEPVEYPDEYTFTGEGVGHSAFETPDGLIDVYRFYTGELRGRGLEVSGVPVLGEKPHFVLEALKDGEDYAIIQAGEKEGKTRFIIWHSL